MKFGGISLALVAGAALGLMVTGASQESTAGATPDVDADGVFNLKDNCVDLYNPYNTQGVQVDSDRDGHGNECDGDFTGPYLGTTDAGYNAAPFCNSAAGATTGNGLLDSKKAYPVCAGNGIINAQDFVYFSAAYNATYNGGADPAYKPRADMNSNGFINAQDFVLFSAQYVLAQPGPSGIRCADTAAGSLNLTQRKPCEAIATHRTKCTGILPQTEPAGVIKNLSTGDDLRFINNPTVATSVLNNGPPKDAGYSTVPGRDGGHCKT